ncbi:MAG TPA: hypothetical protein PKC23_06185 [Candidatus Desulfobacillus sp.]|nr:hypothetical protein [Candidatus Desulfobacillus sp.]
MQTATAESLETRLADARDRLGRSLIANDVKGARAARQDVGELEMHLRDAEAREAAAARLEAEQQAASAAAERQRRWSETRKLLKKRSELAEAAHAAAGELGRLWVDLVATSERITGTAPALSEHARTALVGQVLGASLAGSLAHGGLVQFCRVGPSEMQHMPTMLKNAEIAEALVLQGVSHE